MQLQDIENDVLFNLQQSELVNFGGMPLYGVATNPAISQNALLFQINRAYERVMADLADCEISLAYYQVTSQANLSDYPLPPGGPGVVNYYNPTSPIPNIDLSTNALMMRVSRVLYNPVGQPWTQSHEGGIRLVSWRQFLGYSAFGYLRPFTFNVIPDYVTITPNRQILSFFPGTASNGDLITVEYVPYLTPGTDFPPLVAPTDVPNIPDEATDMLVQWATALCWPKLREMGAMAEYQKMYMQEMMRVREMLGPRSRGDTFAIRDNTLGLAESYPIGGALVLP